MQITAAADRSCPVRRQSKTDGARERQLKTLLAELESFDALVALSPAQEQRLALVLKTLKSLH